MKTTLRQEKGMVLLMVLVVIALLASLTIEFAFSTLVDMRLVETFRDSTRAYYLAKGGVRVGQMILQDDTNGYDAESELWGQGIESYPVGQGFVSVRIEDLGGRLDINRLVTAQGNIDVVFKERFLRLFEDLGFDRPEALVDALIDWIDVDDEPEPEGAENEYYVRLDSPYRCKNGRLDTLEELTMVRGFTAEIFRRLAPYLTVDGGDKINVNTATIEVLIALAEEMDLTAAEAIVAFRESAPIVEVEELKDLPGLGELYWAINSHLRVTSPVYLIRAWGFVGDGSRSLEARVRKADNRLLYIKVN